MNNAHRKDLRAALMSKEKTLDEILLNAGRDIKAIARRAKEKREAQLLRPVFLDEQNRHGTRTLPA